MNIGRFGKLKYLNLRTKKTEKRTFRCLEVDLRFGNHLESIGDDVLHPGDGVLFCENQS